MSYHGEPTTCRIISSLTGLRRLAYEHGRRAFQMGWTVCIYAPHGLRHAWQAGWNDEAAS